MNRNVQSVATFATVGGVTNDVVVSNLAARYLLPHEKVRKIHHDESIDTPLGQASFLEQVSSFHFRFDLNNIETDSCNDTALGALVANFPSTTAEEQLKAVKILERQLPTHSVNWQLILRLKVNGETVPINDLKDFPFVW